MMDTHLGEHECTWTWKHAHTEAHLRLQMQALTHREGKRTCPRHTLLVFLCYSQQLL